MEYRARGWMDRPLHRNKLPTVWFYAMIGCIMNDCLLLLFNLGDGWSVASAAIILFSFGITFVMSTQENIWLDEIKAEERRING